MNEDKKFSKERHKKRASGRYRQKSQGEKLKSETSAKKAYGKKLRHGKKTWSLLQRKRKRLKSFRYRDDIKFAVR